ncbi:FAD-dependent oxidoreductase [Bacillus thuringiensis]|uniref:NAD(P)/FAD-dependent oxidoreductase n=2 Tax=Bacillus thuringiensis TaxID=1428 RepID=A0AB35PGS8_BACTU|nr:MULTISPECIES: FAD-dependent oxidoreductase [Bacillus]EAO55333.1 Rubredoxin-NAD(+) reductase [Bacillus thuringiensis serovar israelensis ATCC 35646]MED1157474.1 FAD-dependent oxidoreductase [Bacillus paranthracis]AJH03177.1 pyridine nucleotide-disulfide oxidoreductase family protein [Bacillus thuringiensis HD1002]APF32467.1 NAD(P)H-nitrite reductase [Bacillus thuringiensis serovar israelensis]KAA0793430.1 NAD(P)/FAD-dependent oxidoreductase [Bacillus sp. BB56-3]
MEKNFVIIGSGVAAVNAAKTIREYDKGSNIFIFGEEPLLPYKRIKLSKDLYSDLHSEKVLIKKKKWYQDNHISFFINTKVVKINTDEQFIVTSNEAVFSYHKLLICTGANNRRLEINGINKKNIFTIRDMKEADELKGHLEDKESVVTIGGGVQGLETAWSILKAGKKVSIVEVAPLLMRRQLDTKSSLLLKRKIEKEGVKVYLNTSIDSILGKESVTGIKMNDNSQINCDSIVYSIGVTPNTKLVHDTAIKLNRGIVVDEKMRTNIDSVYAAGDVAEVNNEIEGLWGTALEQGRVAGSNMVSKTAIYKKEIPTTIFNAFNVSLFSIGVVNKEQCDTTIVEEDGKEKYTRLFIKDNKIVGVISLEGVAASIPYKSAIEKHVSLEGIDLLNTNISEIMSKLKEKI